MFFDPLIKAPKDLSEIIEMIIHSFFFCFRWQHCAISQEKLRKPVVACELGKLYNKVSVQFLLLQEIGNQFNIPLLF